MNNFKSRIDNIELRMTENPFKEYKYIEIVKWVPYEGPHTDVKEYCYTLASYQYDKDGYPELHYCGERPLELNNEEKGLFDYFVRQGYKLHRMDSKNDFKLMY